ncbi:MAG: hypothetical protein J7K48_08370 [Thermococcus sp.]|nr:hypothetical protein [Thermococcus sp.]
MLMGWVCGLSVDQGAPLRSGRLSRCFAGLSKALVLYTFVAVLVTWPLVVNMSTSIYGERSDLIGTLWGFWYLKHAAETGANPGHSNLVNYPYGRDADYNLGPYVKLTPDAWLNVYPVWGIAMLSNENIAFNVRVLLSFILSAILMYLVIHRLTRNWLAAFFGGLVFMISPYRLAITQHYFALTFVECLPLFLLALLSFHAKPNLARSIALGVAGGICFLIEPHYGAYAMMVLVIYLLVSFVYDLILRNPKAWRNVSLTFLGVLLVVSVGYIAFSHIVEIGRTAPYFFSRSCSQMYEDSAQLWQYFLPPVTHPVLGGLTRSLVHDQYMQIFPHFKTLFLGYSVMLLAGAGAFFMLRHGKSADRVLGVVFVLTALGGILLSMPPSVRVCGADIPMPQSALRQLGPWIRTYARFGGVPITVLAILSGVGLKHLLERYVPTRCSRVTLVSLLSLLVFFEYVGLPAAETLDTTHYKDVYYWLQDQFEVQVIAEYPLYVRPEPTGEGTTNWYTYEAFLNQRLHGKVLFNGAPYLSHSYFMKIGLEDLTDATVPARLRWFGVDHVLVRRREVSDDALSASGFNPGLELVHRTPDVDVFRIVSSTAYFCSQRFKITTEGVRDSITEDNGLRTLQLMEGLLIYGPYIALPAGTYRVEFDLMGVPIEADADEYLYLVVSSENGRVRVAERCIGQGEMISGKHLEYSLIFSTEDARNVEFRVYGASGIKGELRFRGVAVERID